MADEAWVLEERRDAGVKVRLALHRLGWSIDRAARESGLAFSTVQDARKGVMGTKTITALARATGQDPRWFRTPLTERERRMAERAGMMYLEHLPDDLPFRCAEGPNGGGNVRPAFVPDAA